MHLLLTIHLMLGAADIGTTTAALQRGAHESMLTQNATVNAAIVGGTVAGTSAGLARFYQQHPKAAKWLAISAMAFRGVVVAQNVRTLRHQGR